MRDGRANSTASGAVLLAEAADPAKVGAAATLATRICIVFGRRKVASGPAATGVSPAAAQACSLPWRPPARKAKRNASRSVTPPWSISVGL